jgi:hypothetical protein
VLVRMSLLKDGPIANDIATGLVMKSSWVERTHRLFAKYCLDTSVDVGNRPKTRGSGTEGCDGCIAFAALPQ